MIQNYQYMMNTFPIPTDTMSANTVTTVTTVTTNLLDILPDNCMELIQLHLLEISCNDIDKSIDDTIEKLLKVVQHHYEQVKYIKNPQKRFNHTWSYSFLRCDLLNT
jgi:hypothetical protein